jgi:hypothetical protein
LYFERNRNGGKEREGGREESEKAVAVRYLVTLINDIGTTRQEVLIDVIGRVGPKVDLTWHHRGNSRPDTRDGGDEKDAGAG